jgi:hypothetical protein
MSKKIRIVQYGCGSIGCSIVRLALRKPNIEIVGAIDMVNLGRDLGEVAGIDRKLGIPVVEDVVSILVKTKPDIVLHSTGSILKEVWPQLEMVIKAGANIISTCEELSYPHRDQKLLAHAIDRLAKEHQSTVLGTGVNPGFLMDTLPLALTAICQNVEMVRVVRVQDASTRRIPFQKKIGAGKTIEEFNKSARAGILRHVGLAESIATVAAGLKWELDDITEIIKPVIAKTDLSNNFLTIKPGQVAGVKQTGYGLKDGTRKVILELQAYMGAKKSYDAIYITGSPNIGSYIKGGVHGDLATTAIVVNSIERVIDAPPGLLTMKDLPIVCALINE